MIQIGAVGATETKCLIVHGGGKYAGGKMQINSEICLTRDEQERYEGIRYLHATNKKEMHGETVHAVRFSPLEDNADTRRTCNNEV